MHNLRFYHIIFSSKKQNFSSLSTNCVVHNLQTLFSYFKPLFYPGSASSIPILSRAVNDLLDEVKLYLAKLSTAKSFFNKMYKMWAFIKCQNLNTIFVIHNYAILLKVIYNLLI